LKLGATDVRKSVKRWRSLSTATAASMQRRKLHYNITMDTCKPPVLEEEVLHRTLKMAVGALLLPSGLWEDEMFPRHDVPPAR
jgi:hypothetical protein